jgi:hypothetical protein
VRIVRINAEIQSSVARIVYPVSGINFKINEDITGVMIAANSQ